MHHRKKLSLAILAYFSPYTIHEVYKILLSQFCMLLVRLPAKQQDTGSYNQGVRSYTCIYDSFGVVRGSTIPPKNIFEIWNIPSYFSDSKKLEYFTLEKKIGYFALEDMSSWRFWRKNGSQEAYEQPKLVCKYLCLCFVLTMTAITKHHILGELSNHNEFSHDSIGYAINTRIPSGLVSSKVYFLCLQTYSPSIFAAIHPLCFCPSNEYRSPTWLWPFL